VEGERKKVPNNRSYAKLVPQNRFYSFYSFYAFYAEWKVKIHTPFFSAKKIDDMVTFVYYMSSLTSTFVLITNRRYMTSHNVRREYRVRNSMTSYLSDTHKKGSMKVLLKSTTSSYQP
jgi:hypothetical protein